MFCKRNRKTKMDPPSQGLVTCELRIGRIESNLQWRSLSGRTGWSDFRNGSVILTHRINIIDVSSITMTCKKTK